MRATCDRRDTTLSSRTPNRMLDTNGEGQNSEGGNSPERPAHVGTMKMRGIRLRSSLVSNAYQRRCSLEQSAEQPRPEPEAQTEHRVRQHALQPRLIGMRGLR